MQKTQLLLLLTKKAGNPQAGTLVGLLSSGEGEGGFWSFLASPRITGPWYASMTEWFSGLLVSGQLQAAPLTSH